MNAPKVFFTWDIHYRCRYNCTYCFLRHETETSSIPARILPVDELYRVWRGLYERYGSARISVTGGEPFDYPGFMDLAARLAEFDTFEFSTNLDWDAREFSAKVPAGAAKINPSFHPDHASLSEFLDKCLHLREKGYGLDCATVFAYPPNFEALKAHKAECVRRGVNLVVFPFRGPYQGREYPKAYTESERAALRELGAGAAEEVNAGLAKSHSLDSGPRERLQDRVCAMGTRYAKIVPNGDAFRCCAAVWTPAKTWPNWGPLGNIYDGTFRFDDAPRPCAIHEDGECRCHKAMVVGREADWRKHWPLGEEAARP